MKRFISRLSYANVMSTIAMFFVLTGATAVAANKLAKNSVGSKQIRKNAVTSSEIKKNAVTNAKLKNDAVTGSKVKDGTLTGADINLAALGTVPQASTFSGFSRTGTTRVAATSGATLTAARAAAPATPLSTVGPFTLYGKCEVVAGTISGEIFIKTSLGGSIFDSDDDDLHGDPFLEPSTGEDDRRTMYKSASTNDASIYGLHSSEVLAQAPDGTVLRADTSIAVKGGNLPGGNGIYGDGDVCLFTSVATQLNQ